VLVEDPSLLPGRDLLVTPHPYLALARALELLHPAPQSVPGIHSSAVVAPDVVVGRGASIGPHVSVAEGSTIGDGVVIGAGCALGRGVKVGRKTLLHPRVVIEDRCRIGEGCVLHAGVVIGSDGFGFATVDGVHHKVPQVGIVVIEDEVELGANVCVDRAALGVTRVGRGTKVDNMVKIGHNVDIGEGAILVAQVGLAGSARLGHHVVMAGQSGVAGHLKVGDHVTIGAKTSVYKDLPDGAFVTGTPARPHREWLRANANLRRIETMRQRLKELEREVGELRSRCGG